MDEIQEITEPLNLSDNPQEYAAGISFEQIVLLRDQIIENHKRVLTVIQNLNEDYRSKIASLSEQQLILLGQVTALNALLPENLRREK